MTRLVIRGGRVVDPSIELNARRDVIVEDGKVAALVSPRAGASHLADRVIDATGLLVTPGWIDLHVHLRVPGMEAAEDISTGTRAAAAGGFTTVVCMPNTRPVLDSAAKLQALQTLIGKQALVHVLVAPALSEDLRGDRLTDIRALARAGAAAVSDDGVGTRAPDLFRAALQHAAACNLAVLAHCEDHEISQNGVLTAGAQARKLGLSGISAKAEGAATKRAVQAARAGGRLHVQHVSTRGALSSVRRAKALGLAVSCEATPHHLYLAVDAIQESAGPKGPDPNLKMNPPLRTQADRQALLQGLCDGTVDAIASDHAPHTRSAKDRGFSDAPFGVIGLETTLPLVLRLVEEGKIPLVRAIALMTCGPAAVLGIDSGTLQAGRPADITVLDPEESWRVVPSRLKSRSKNTAFSGWTMKGHARWTIAGGRIVYRR